MPINTSRYKRSTEWDGPKKQARKPMFASAEVWRKRFYISFIAGIVVVVLLAGAFGYVLWKNRSTTPKTADSTQTTDSTDTSSWKKSENPTANLTFLYPPDWNLATNKTQTDLDLLNIQLAGAGSNGATSTVKVDVIKNTSNLSLADWVKQFGPKDIQTESTTIASEPALLAKFSNNDTGEEQNVYYVSKGNNIYVFDLYQSAKDDTLKGQLSQFSGNVTFTATTSTTPTTPSATATTTTNKLVVNTAATSFEDQFFTYKPDGTAKTALYDDKDEKVFLKGSVEVFTASGVNKLVGHFGKSGTTSADGIYSTTLAGNGELKEIVSGVTPGLIRVSQNGTVIGYLDGEKGVAKKIKLVDALGKSLYTVTAGKAVQYFAISNDGLKVAYVTSGSSKIIIATQDNNAARTLGDFTTATIYALDWFELGESGDAFAYVTDGSKYSNKSELLYVTSEGKNSIADATPKKLSTDSVAQDNPRFNSDGTTIAYRSYTSGTSGKSSIWVIGTDAKNDTNIVKSGNNSIAGWISQ